MGFCCLASYKAIGFCASTILRPLPVLPQSSITHFPWEGIWDEHNLHSTPRCKDLLWPKLLYWCWAQRIYVLRIYRFFHTASSMLQTKISFSQIVLANHFIFSRNVFSLLSILFFKLFNTRSDIFSYDCWSLAFS